MMRLSLLLISKTTNGMMTAASAKTKIPTIEIIPIIPPKAILSIIFSPLVYSLKLLKSLNVKIVIYHIAK